MQITSNYYRSVSLRAGYTEKFLTVPEEDSDSSSSSISKESVLVPLSPSDRTLRGLAALYKSVSQD